MNIIKEKWLFLNATVSGVPQQIRKLYAFGVQTISAEQVASLRANARLAGLRWATAKSKIWRLTKNARIIPIFPKFLVTLALCSPADTVVVDFSDFGNGFQVLMLRLAMSLHHFYFLFFYFSARGGSANGIAETFYFLFSVVPPSCSISAISSGIVANGL